MNYAICNAAIDWAATGAMLQGWATFAGALAVLTAAKIGESTFEKWKRQKLAERHLEQAERILTAVYRARTALASARSPMMMSYEQSAAEQVLKADLEWPNQSAARQKRLITAQAFYARLNRTRDQQQELNVCQPIARALFGAELERALSNLVHQFWLVQVDVDSHVDDDGTDKEFSASIRGGMYASMSKKNPDKIALAVEEAITSIEAICLPILRMETISRPRRGDQPWPQMASDAGGDHLR